MGSARDVTVVVPAWGRHVGLLPEAVASLTAQEPAPTVLVVDNQSERPFPDLHPSVGVLRTARRLSVGAARNFGLKHVTSDLVMFWDADDVMLPGTIAALLAAVEEDQAVLAAARIVEDDGTWHHWPRPSTAWISAVPGVMAAVHSVSSLFPTTGAVLMRTEAIRSGGGFPDADGGDDWVAGLSVALRGRVVLIDHPGRIYRRYRGSVSSSWGLRDRLAHARLVRERLSEDPLATAPWARLPAALALLQWSVIFALGPVRRLLAGGARPVGTGVRPVETGVFSAAEPTPAWQA